MNTPRTQSLSTEQFFYFFLRLRKGEVRRTVETLRARYPEEAPEQLARRLIRAKIGLSALGGALLSLPMAWPALGQGLKILGVVGATSMMTRMHLYLILEIALAFGRDIDDKARVGEMAAVVAATGIGSASPLLLKDLGLNPVLAVTAGAVAEGSLTRLIGQAAIRHYAGQVSEGLAAAEASGD